jgi:uncharacterized protein with GYD domain
LKAVAYPQHKSSAVREFPDRIHHRRKARERTGSQVITVGKSAGKYDGVVRRQIGVTVPDEVDWLAHVF